MSAAVLPVAASNPHLPAAASSIMNAAPAAANVSEVSVPMVSEPLCAMVTAGPASITIMQRRPEPTAAGMVSVIVPEQWISSSVIAPLPSVAMV